MFDSETRILQLGKISDTMLKKHRNYGLFPSGFISSETPEKRVSPGQLENIKKMTFFQMSQFRAVIDFEVPAAYRAALNARKTGSTLFRAHSFGFRSKMFEPKF